MLTREEILERLRELVQDWEATGDRVREKAASEIRWLLEAADAPGDAPQEEPRHG